MRLSTPCVFLSLVVLSLAVFSIKKAFGELPSIEIKSSSESRYGAHIDEDGWVHFVVYSPDATLINLLLFDEPHSTAPLHTIPMNKVGNDWRVRVKGQRIGAGQFYMYQAEGPHDISNDDQYGFMFNKNYFLSDPYAYKTQNVTQSSVLASIPPFVDIASSNYAGGGKSIVYDHSNDQDPGHIEIKAEDLIVYELHVQDYTARVQGLDPSRRGTYLGLTQSGLQTPGGLASGIDHLVELGINAVELMPVMEYDEETGNAQGRLNHWGYMTTNFFAPEARYASVPGNQIVELKELVRAFHERGIAVFMDVVYNHTGEGGPWKGTPRPALKSYNFMGLSNTRVFRSTSDGKFYMNNTGTGNDISYVGSDDRYTKRVVTDSLALWHRTYGIDGFRFDLSRILADGSHSAADWVDNDQRFAAAHLHAEPWDLGGQWYDFMDNFGWNHTNNRWAKWIGRYRDKIRRFSGSNLNSRTSFKQLIEGYGSVSETVGAPASTKPWRTINFLAVHDGYTLRDCVLFTDSDASHNCWDSGGDENLRREREKLLLGILLTSQGVPLLLQGDEFGRTKSHASSQADAHNTYNYESTEANRNINHVNWIDWRLKDGDTSESPNAPKYGQELFHWTKDFIALRKQWSHFRQKDFPQFITDAWNGGVNSGAANDGKFSYSWEGPSDGEPTQLAVIWWGKTGEPDIMAIYNEHFDEFTVANLTDWSQGDWKVLARSWFGDDLDFCSLENWETQCESAGNSLNIKARSMAVLISDND